MVRFRWLLAALLAASLAVFFACGGSSSSSGIPPITGIVIRAETLTTGHGCGRAPSQLFKYAAVVYGFDESAQTFTAPVTGAVYDCFTDGTFVELPTVGGSTTFRLEVFAYDAQAYDAARDAIESAFTNGAALRDAKPTWTTECFATQQPNVQSLAVCGPLVEGHPEARIAVDTSAFLRADGSKAVCARTVPADAGADSAAADAGADAATDAAADSGLDGGTNPDASGPPDAGPPPTPGLEFLRVRFTTHVNATALPAAEIDCPERFVLHDAVPSAHYTLDVDLLGAGGAVVGKTTCTADAVPGAESSATCAPVP